MSRRNDEDNERSHYGDWSDEQLAQGIEFLQDVKRHPGFRLLLQEVVAGHGEAVDALIQEQDPVKMYRLQGAIESAGNLIGMADDVIDHMTTLRAEIAAQKTVRRQQKRREATAHGI